MCALTAYSSPTGRTVLQAGLAPVRYERVADGGVVSSAYTPEYFAARDSNNFGRTPMRTLSYGRTENAYNSTEGQFKYATQAPTVMYRAFASPSPLVYNERVTPRTSTLHHTIPQPAPVSQQEQERAPALT